MKLYPKITNIFLIWFFSIFIIFIYGFLNFPPSDKFNHNFWESLSNWDGRHYLGIAEFGYKEKFQYAFFPLYPILIRVVNYIIHSYFISALLISFMSIFLSLHLLYKFIYLIFDKKIAEKVILYLLFFPTSFYFLIAYSESLFFFLTIAVFYLSLKNRFFWATIFASLAGATRLAGLAVILGFLFDVWSREGFNKKNWFVFFSFLGFLIYCWFLFKNTGNPLYFVIAEQHWLRSLATPDTGFLETFRNIARPGFINNNFNAVFDLLFAIFGLGIILRSFRFLPLSYSLFALTSITLPLFTPSLSSIPRFLLPIFPIFIVLALIKNERILLLYQMVSLMILSAFAILFINGYWVS